MSSQTERIPVTKDEFLAYEAVRLSGATNMFMVNVVCDLSGLERGQVLYVMEHYAELYEQHRRRTR